MDWMLIGLLFLLIVIYIVMNVSRMGGVIQPSVKLEIEDYQADELMLKIYYGRQERFATADLQDFEKDGTIWITVFETEPVVNEVQRQAEGKWVRAGKAIVRCDKNTGRVLSWTHIE